MGPAMNVQKELMAIPDFGDGNGAVFSKEQKAIGNFKKAILMTAGAAAQKLMMKLESEQEILMNIADMIIKTFTAESVLLRVMKLSQTKKESDLQFELDLMRVYLNDCSDDINRHGKEAVNAFAQGDDQRMMLLGIKRFTKLEPFNTKDARRRIADKMIRDGRYQL